MNHCLDLAVQHVSTINIQKKDDKSHVLKSSCDFDYLAERFTLNLHSGHITFQATSIKIYFRKQSIAACTFGNNAATFEPNDVFSTSISFSKFPIDFFGFSEDRIFMINFTFKSTRGATFEAVFSITLPVIQQSEIYFSPPGTSYPDNVTRRICKQGFQLNNENSDPEIKQCILLEEFKLFPVESRYKVYGYVEMLNLFLDIENSFELDLVQKCNLINVSVEKLGTTRYKINASSSNNLKLILLLMVIVLCFRLSVKSHRPLLPFA